MIQLEDLQPRAALRGLLPDCLVTVVSVQWFGSEALELTYKMPAGKVANELVYRNDEPRLDLVEQGRPWSFDGDGALFRLVSEAHRIRLAHLFDPVLAVHTSLVDPLPHQITAVYESMLPRQPLRFLLADDPGAGKTIMAGLLIKELIARGDLQRCLIVCPGSLAEQWQDELYRRFHLPFEILTNDKLEAARTGNWFFETNLVIARLDKLSRNEDVRQKLQSPDCRWDLVVCDEAHKMLATVFGKETKYTKRYHLGQLLSTLTRHFLLMTATPHNGKETDFQLFMALLDGDRFEGRFRDGVHVTDVSDLMRRMVKEKLLKFDGAPLFPERIAYTVPYKLSTAEARLYKAVTDYVREEFNRAEALDNGKRTGTVGFALTILQRRLASSPEAIYQSLRRRRERLESCLREMEVLQRGVSVNPANFYLDSEDIEDLEEAPENEVEAAEEEILDQATAARTITELKAEIETLKELESLALVVRRSGADTKWLELSSLLCEIFTTAAIANCVADPVLPYGAGEIPRPTPSPHQKLVLFTEHRDTLNYLQLRITALLGRLEHAIQDAGLTRSGERRVVSKRMLYVELDADGTMRHVHYAPYLDYRPLAENEPGIEAILDRPECAWVAVSEVRISSSPPASLELKAQGYAVAHVVPEHLAEVRNGKLGLITKTEAAVKERLTKEITYWDHRSEQLKLQEQSGKPNARLNSGEARKRADALQVRLRKRLDELKLEAQISPLPPVIIGGLLVVPMGLLATIAECTEVASSEEQARCLRTQEAAARARAIIMEIERSLGFEPFDREFERLGYDIESHIPGTGKLRFIEVKGRITGASTITVTRNEILYSLNKPEDFILAIVEFTGDDSHRVHYIKQPFQREPDFGVTSVNYDFAELLVRAETPR
jgi:hypothetical protein